MKTLARGNTTYQRRMDRIVRASGYTFDHQTNGHNWYSNQLGQRISVAGTPKNEGHGERALLAEIKRQVNQRKAPMPSQTTIDPVDAIIAQADTFLLKTPTDKRSRDARYHALVGFVKRSTERLGPIRARDLTDAIYRLGYSRDRANDAKRDAGIVSYRIHEDGKGMWMNALPHQVPKGHNHRKDQNTGGVKPHDVQVTLSDPNEAIPSPALEAATNGVSSASRGEYALAKAVFSDNSTEVNAAAYMLLESLGIKAPGQDAKDALKAAHDALSAAGKAVLDAQTLVVRAQMSLQ